MRAPASVTPKAAGAPAPVTVNNNSSAASLMPSAAMVTATLCVPAAVKVRRPPLPPPSSLLSRLAVVVQSAAESTPVTAQSTVTPPAGNSPLTATMKSMRSPSFTSSTSAVPGTRSPAGAVADTVTSTPVMVKVSGASSNASGASAGAPVWPVRVMMRVSGASASASLRIFKSKEPVANAPVGISTVPVPAVASKVTAGDSVRVATL